MSMYLVTLYSLNGSSHRDKRRRRPKVIFRS